MSRQIKDIKDKNTGLLVYPRTHIKAVVIDESTNLEDFIGTNVGERLDQIEDILAFTGDGTKYLADDGVYREVVTDLSEYEKTEDVDNKLKNYVTSDTLLTELDKKVSKVNGKQLSTEDFTTELKAKLEAVTPFDPSEINQSVLNLSSRIDTLVNADSTTAINTFNEIIAFLEGIENSEDLDSIIANIELLISNILKSKLDTITDLGTIRSGAMLGSTSVQPTDISDMETKTNAANTYLPIGDYATKSETVSKINDIESQINIKQDKSLYFNDVIASNWVSDPTYSDFPYRCDISCTGVTENMYAEVILSIEHATSGEYAPVCETNTDIVSIWASTNVQIIIPTIIITK